MVRTEGNSGSGLGTRGQTRESRVRPRTCSQTPYLQRRWDQPSACAGSATTWTSMPDVPRSTASTSEPPKRVLSGERRLLPTTICVMCCALASRMISAAGLSARRRRKTPPRERVSASASARTRGGLGVDAAVLRLDAEHVELRVAATRQARAGADEIGVGVAAAADGDQDALDRPRSGRRALELGGGDLGQLVQHEGAQRGQVLDREEALERRVDAVGRIHEPARDALAQRARAEIDEPDLVGLVEPAVGERLAHVDAGQRADAAVEALEVLDVDGRPDVDAVLEQERDVVVALAPGGARGVGVGELVDDRDARAALEQPVDSRARSRLVRRSLSARAARARVRARAPRSARRPCGSR